MAAILLLFAAPAAAQDAANITVNLAPAEVAAIQRSLDRHPISQTPPPGFWSLQTKINQALAANPEAQRAFQSAFESARSHGR
ncbi:hypothetical protein [Bradyrhizobium sp. S3.2.12]|uniref:hypothetical protein n=1 Tax=Bradyrhizobium sp. S3.2.12 TaxID=3156387 RepID=UPI00339B2321